MQYDSPVSYDAPGCRYNRIDLFVDPRFELGDEPAREFALRGRQAAPVDWGARHFDTGRRKRTFEVSE